MHKVNKLLFFLLINFAIFGVAENSEAAINGVLRVHPTNPRYFTDNSGKAIYLTGSHTWTNFKDMGTANPPQVFSYNAYLDFLQSSNHNFFRLWTWELTRFQFSGKSLAYVNPFPWPRTGPGTALDGGLKFDLSKLDQAYFDRMRSRIIAARDRGIYVAVMLFEGNGVNGSSTSPWTWNAHPFNLNNNINGIDGNDNGDSRGIEIHQITGTAKNSAARNIEKAYVGKVIDTVNDLDNVLYEIANEIGAYSTAWQYDMINYIKNYESAKAKQHPVGMTFQYPDGNNNDLFNSPADWISPNRLASSPYDYLTNPPPATGNKVIIPDSDHLGSADTANRGRAWAWENFSRGNHPIHMDPLLSINGSSLYNVFTSASSEPANTPDLRKAMGHTLTYANKMNLIAMVPSANSSDCSTTFCLRNPGQEYLVYQSLSGAFTVNLSAGDYNYEWFNPVTGLVAGTGTATASGGNKSFTPPFSGNAVLYLIKKQTFNSADVNQDGNINIQDIQICVKVITETLTNPRADVNGDGVKNIKDIQQIVRTIVNP